MEREVRRADQARVRPRRGRPHRRIFFTKVLSPPVVTNQPELPPFSGATGFIALKQSSNQNHSSQTFLLDKLISF